LIVKQLAMSSYIAKTVLNWQGKNYCFTSGGHV